MAAALRSPGSIILPTPSPGLTVRLGTITKVHDDGSGFLQARTGDRYRFYSDGVWEASQHALAAGVEVVFELNSSGRVARAVRKLKRSKIVPLINRRSIPAMVTGRGVVTTRFAADVYLSVAQVAAHRLTEGMILLVRVNLSNTYTSAPQVLELAVVEEEQAALFSQALSSPEEEAELKQQELKTQLAAIGTITTEEQLQTVVKLMQLRNGYTSQFLGRILEAEPSWGQQLQRAGFEMCLTIESLLEMLSADASFTPRQLPDTLLSPYCRMRLDKLGRINTKEACEELAELYHLGRQKNLVIFSPEELVKLDIDEPCWNALWVEGLPVPMPAQPGIVQALQKFVRANDQASAHRLVQQCNKEGVAIEVCQAVLAESTQEYITRDFMALSGALDVTQRTRLVEDLRHRVTEALLESWWEQDLITDIPADLIAARLVYAGDTYRHNILHKYALLEGATTALVQAAEQALRASSKTTLYDLLQDLSGNTEKAKRKKWEAEQKKRRRWSYDGYYSHHSHNQAPIQSTYRYQGWANSTLLELRHLSILLPAKEQINWWLEGLGTEPSRDVLAKEMPTLAKKKLERAWLLLPEQSLTMLLESLADWLRQELPVSWTELALRQLKSRWGAGAQPVRQQLQATVVSQLPEATQLAYWQEGLTGQPADTVVQYLLGSANTEQAIQIVGELTSASLPLILPVLFGRLASEHLLAEQVLRKLATEQVGLPAFERLKADVFDILGPTTEPSLYLNWWQAGIVPPPPVAILVEGMRRATSHQRLTMLNSCSGDLLLGYGRHLEQHFDRTADTEDILRACVSQLIFFPDNQEQASEVLAALLSHVDASTSLRWWAEGIDIDVSWQSIEQGLQQEELRQKVLIEVVKRRLADLLAYLPQAPASLLFDAIPILTDRGIMAGHSGEAQVSVLVSLAGLLCQHHAQDPEKLRNWLKVLLQRCQSADLWTADNHYALSVADRGAAIRQLIDYWVTPSLLPGELLLYWQDELLGYFPLVPLEEIARIVASQLIRTGSRLWDEARIPDGVQRAWQGLASLRNNSDSQLKLTAQRHIGALNHADLVRGINPWLLQNLTTKQLELLWMHGYPVPQPHNWSGWSIPIRMLTSVLFAKQRSQQLPMGFVPTTEEIEEWLAEQYWEEEDQQLANQMLTLLRDYYTLAVVELPPWQKLESDFLVRCAGVVKVRLWMTLPPESQQHTFNYYTFRRGYGRLRTAEQREFLHKGQPYLRQVGKTEQDFKGALHLRRRRLVRQQDGISVYRICLAHCYCPKDGQLEVELADKGHTRPCAYPDAETGWNDKFVREPWAGCPVLAYVDDQTLELVKIQGLEAALTQYPTDQQPKPLYDFRRVRKTRGTTDNPVGYWEDESLHDELSGYLLELAEKALLNPVALTERMTERSERAKSIRPTQVNKPEDPIEGNGTEEIDDVDLGLPMLPRQTVLSPIILQEDVVFVWAPQFANSNRATYVFRAPLLYQEQSLGRLTDLLQNVSGIRSALLAPGLASHRLRRHLGYVRTIRGQRGQAQAFQAWQKRLDDAIEAGPARQHTYDPDSDFDPMELHGDQAPAPTEAYAAPETTTAQETEVSPERQAAATWQARAQQHLQQLRQLNEFFLSGYSA